MVNIIIAIIILLAYTFVMIRVGGTIPPSLSASVYFMPKSKRWIWTVVLFAVCFLCVPTIIEKSNENTQFLAFLAIAGLGFVGAAPLVPFKEDSLQFRVHEIGAIVCAACSQLLLMFNCPWLLTLWVPFIVAGFIIGWKKWRTMIFFGEAVCFASTFIYCLI